MERASRETWVKRVERWKDSGLSAAEYAKELGISPKALSWWKWQLSKASAPKKMKRKTRGASVAPLTFVEMSAPTRAEPLEVVLVTGLRVRVPIDFDAAALERLLGILSKSQ